MQRNAYMCSSRKKRDLIMYMLICFYSNRNVLQTKAWKNLRNDTFQILFSLYKFNSLHEFICAGLSALHFLINVYFPF